MSKDPTFVRITNKEVYNEIQELKAVLSDFIEVNERQHSKLEQQVRLTNGKVKLHQKLIFGLGGVFISGFIFILTIMFNFLK